MTSKTPIYLEEGWTPEERLIFIMQEAADVEKGQPAMSDTHINTPLGSKKKKRKKKKRKPRDLLAPQFNKNDSPEDPPELVPQDILSPRFRLGQAIKKHMGPGPHPSGSPQSVHGSGRGRGPSRKEIADQTSEGGFTVDPATGDYPKSGYMVSVGGFEETYDIDSLSLSDIGNYRAKNWSNLESHPNAYWGGWVEDDGTVYFDISVHTDSLDEAVRLGNRFDQRAIFSLDTFEDIRLDDDGLSLSDFRSRLES